MAELAVLNIAKSLLQQLSTPAKDEFKLWFNSDTELKKLENTIRTIRDVVVDAEQKKANNTDIGGWLSRLKDEMYKADDLFDTVSTRALQKQVTHGGKFRKEMKIFFSKSNQLAFVIKTSHKVKELRERLDDIAKDISQFGLLRDSNHYDQRIVMKRDAQHSYISNDEVIGREREKEELLRLLLADGRAEERVSVIGVVGIGGQGKTALAQLLYNAKVIGEFFELRLWACVNYFTDLKAALEEITGTKADSLEELQNRLRSKISGKRFLLVIDDVWDDIREQWLRVKRLLDAGERGSKILMTTRSETIAQNLATIRPHYALGELSDDHAWILFKRMAFDGNNEEENQTKEDLGSLIMKKCPKVPLAIRTVGSFLYGKDKKQWSEFVDSDLMKAMPSRENIVMQVLRRSYDDLPLSVKRCFTYCSVFPKDYHYNKSTLIYLWMAQGFLDRPEKNTCLEDVGESHFLYLTQRCFFQNVTVGDEGDILSCKMHDLLHDLAVQISADECLSMLNIAEELGTKLPRHLLVKDITGKLLECKGIRSLLSPDSGFVERTVFDSVFLNLTSLRTLSLRRLDVEEIPSSIGKLVHLRYLDLKDSKRLIKLPDALCKLHNLITLSLEGCESLIKLPYNMQKLISLRHLSNAKCVRLNLIPSGFEELTSLTKLDLLVVHKEHGGLRYLKHLNNLTGEIGIEISKSEWKNCVADAEECMLKKKIKIDKLSISWTGLEIDEELHDVEVVLHKLQPPDRISCLNIYWFPGVKLPYWLSSLFYLVELTLHTCSRCNELPQLSHLLQLKKLEVFHLPLVEYMENEMCCDSTTFFPSLEVLSMEYMSGLKGWCRSTGKEICGAYRFCFPRLRELVIDDCPELTSMPPCPAMEALNLRTVSVDVVKQLLGLPNSVESEADSSVVSTSEINFRTCSQLDSLCLYAIDDLSLLSDEFTIHSFVRHLSIQECLNFKHSSLFILLEHFSSLESLVFEGLNATEMSIGFENMAREGMPWRWLTRLKKLVFDFGSDVVGTHLLNGLHHLTSLEHLVIRGSLPPHNEAMQWSAPPNLKQLTIQDVREMAYLEKVFHRLDKLQHLVFYWCTEVEEPQLNKLSWKDLKSLRKLEFWHLHKLRSISDNCQHLLALEDLEISFCNQITCLPDWINRLTSLNIYCCRGLKDKCRKPMGEYWPLIKDIPYLSIC